MNITDFQKNASTFLKLYDEFPRKVLASCLYGIETEGYIKPSPYFPDRYDFSEDCLSENAKCVFGFSEKMAKIEPPRPRADTKAQQIVYRRTWQSMLEKWALPDNKLEAWLENRREHAPIIRAGYPSGELVHWRGALRGTVEYSRKLAAKMRHDAWNLQQRYKYVYFLTYTFMAERYTKSRVDAWSNYSRIISGVMKAAREKFGFGYQWVLESTSHGYPHAHIVLFTNCPPDEAHTKYEKRTRLATGALYRFCRDHSPAKQMQLEWAESKSVVKYLQKYIGKSTERKIYSIPDGSDKDELKSWRKDILTLMCPAICGVRAYGCSQWRRVALLSDGRTDGVKDYVMSQREAASRVIWQEETVYTPNFELLFTKPQDYFQFQMWFNAQEVFLHKLADTHAQGLRQAALDWLLTNLRPRCSHIIDLITDVGCKSEYLRLENSESLDFASFSKKVDACALPVGCRDCILKRLYMRRAGRDVPLDPNQPIQSVLKTATFTAGGIDGLERIPFTPILNPAKTATADLAAMAEKAKDTAGERITAQPFPEKAKTWQKFAEEENERLMLGDSGLAQIMPNKIKTREDFLGYKKWVEENYSKIMGEREVIHRIKGEVMDKVLSGQKVQMHYERLYWTVAIVRENGIDRGGLYCDWLEAFSFDDNRIMPFCQYSLNPDDALKFYSHNEAFLMANLLGKYTDGVVNTKVYQCGTGQDILADVVTGKSAIR